MVEKDLKKIKDSDAYDSNHEGTRRHTILEKAKERIGFLKDRAKLTIGIAGLAGMMLTGAILHDRYAVKPLTNADIDRAGKFFKIKYEREMEKKQAEFNTRKFDIQQTLEVNGTDYSSNEIGCIVVVPLTARNFGQAFLFNAVTEKGYWYQIGIAQGFSIGTVDSNKFSIIYQASDPVGKVLYETTQLKNSIEQNRAYNISIKLKGKDVIAEVSDPNGKLLKSIVGPSFGSKRFVGGKWKLKNGTVYFTGPMTEVISAKRDVRTGTATYIFTERELTNVRSFKLSSDIISSVVTKDMSLRSFDYSPHNSAAKIGKREELRMGYYIESLAPVQVVVNGKRMSGYSFTTSSLGK